MTSETAEHPGTGAAMAARTAPTATISLRALHANARLLAERGCAAPLVGTLSHDAWGHGASAVDDALRTADAQVPVPIPRSGSPRSGSPLGEPWAPDAARDGRTLLGLPGSDGQPVMRLSGAVLSVKRLRAGEGVSYGYTHRAPADTRVALVTGGYAQGVVRSIGNRVDLMIAGRPHRIVGRVAMDVCVVDIGDTAVSRGEEAVFFGDPAVDAPSLAAWTAATGLTAVEIVTLVGQRAYRTVSA